MTALDQAIEVHVRSYFREHRVEKRVWRVGPMHRLAPTFSVLEVSPGPKSALWNYVSAGAGSLVSEEKESVEFILVAPLQIDRAVELVTMAAWYHAKENLGIGHTLPIGEPWMEGSSCDHFLVSLPYPFGPEFEVVARAAKKTRILWLLPITKAERDYKIAHGQDALERLLESNAIQHWVSDRASVVPPAAG